MAQHVYGSIDGVFLHWIFEIVGVSNLSLEPDELHIIYLGTLQYFLGTVLWILTYIVLTEDPVSNIERIWELIRKEYNVAVGNQYSQFGLNFKEHDKHYPCLKGKGMEARDLVIPLSQVWAKLTPGHLRSNHTQPKCPQSPAMEAACSCKDCFKGPFKEA